MHRHVDAPLGLQRVQGVGDLLDRLVAAVERRAEDRHHADRVLVALGDGALRRSGDRSRPPSAPAAARPPSSGRTSPSTPGRWRPSPGWAGRSGLPAFCIRSRQRHLSAIPASIAASLEPVVEHPVAFSCSGEFHRSARMLTQRASISAVCGYSSLSIMFLSAVSAIRRAPKAGIHVVTNVARLSRAWPSSSSSLVIRSYATSPPAPVSRQAVDRHLGLADRSDREAETPVVCPLLMARAECHAALLVARGRRPPGGPARTETIPWRSARRRP